MSRPIDAQPLSDAADGPLLELALGALSLARDVERLARTAATPGADARSTAGDEPARLACLGLLSLARSVERGLTVAAHAPRAEPAANRARAPGLLR